MPKVQSRGAAIIDGKKIDLEEFDDSAYIAKTAKNTTKNKVKEDELEKEVLRQTGHHVRQGQSKAGGI